MAVSKSVLSAQCVLETAINHSEEQIPAASGGREAGQLTLQLGEFAAFGFGNVEESSVGSSEVGSFWILSPPFLFPVVDAQIPVGIVVRLVTIWHFLLGEALARDCLDTCSFS